MTKPPGGIDPFAVASLVLAGVTVVGVFCCVGYFAGALSLALGALALLRTRREERATSTTISAWLGIVVSAAAMLGHGGCVSVMAVADQVEGEHAAADAADRAQREAVAAEVEAKRLVEEAPVLATKIATELVQVDAAITRNDPAGARMASEPLRVALTPYLSAPPLPATLSPADDALRIRESIISALEAVARGDQLVAAGSMLDADAEFARASFALAALPKEYLATAALPLSWADVEARRKTIAKRVTKERRALEKAEAARAEAAEEAARLAALCGTAPMVSGWDGSVLAVEREMARTANDPDSIEVSECTSPVLTTACWRTRCRVRGKNAFGALVLNEYTFFISTAAKSSPGGVVLAIE